MLKRKNKKSPNCHILPKSILITKLIVNDSEENNLLSIRDTNIYRHFSFLSSSISFYFIHFSLFDLFDLFFFTSYFSTSFSFFCLFSFFYFIFIIIFPFLSSFDTVFLQPGILDYLHCFDCLSLFFPENDFSVLGNIYSKSTYYKNVSKTKGKKN